MLDLTAKMGAQKRSIFKAFYLRLCVSATSAQQMPCFLFPHAVTHTEYLNITCHRYRPATKLFVESKEIISIS